ncbi:MAG: ATP-binding protein, partial [Psychrobacter sp.]|nr:ATP-binding protein [Psychrobacter sp.]
KLRTKLFEMKPFVEAINGNTGSQSIQRIKNVNQSSLYVETATDNAQNIIKHIEHGMRGEGRNISILDIINITVTLQQSFISFLAGLPGGGKTTLARLVAKIYGIQENRFLDVSVARGWTGQRDLIGFHNPISNKFQSSSTGMYEFLSALSDEAQEENIDSPLSLVLLDEANLSSMEHYWSSFMGMTDSRGTESLRLGENNIQVADNLRFISTINYDNTTEYLSPRLIDRAPIIVLEPNTVVTTSNQIVDESYQPLIDVPISYKTMEKYFGRTNDIPEFVGPELDIYDQVKSVLEERNSELGKPIVISNRKEISIRQYCNKARPLMREFSTDDELLAIDYAILQMILPLLRGHGKSFGKRLVKLREVLVDSELDRSVNYLDNIINNGNAELNTYDFFCW